MNDLHHILNSGYCFGMDRKSPRTLINVFERYIGSSDTVTIKYLF